MVKRDGWAEDLYWIAFNFNFSNNTSKYIRASTNIIFKHINRCRLFDTNLYALRSIFFCCSVGVGVVVVFALEIHFYLFMIVCATHVEKQKRRNPC